MKQKFTAYTLHVQGKKSTYSKEVFDAELEYAGTAHELYLAPQFPIVFKERLQDGWMDPRTLVNVTHMDKYLGFPHATLNDDGAIGHILVLGDDPYPEHEDRFWKDIKERIEFLIDWEHQKAKQMLEAAQERMAKAIDRKPNFRHAMNVHHLKGGKLT